jgi:hypothetical protein
MAKADASAEMPNTHIFGVATLTTLILKVEVVLEQTSLADDRGIITKPIQVVAPQRFKPHIKRAWLAPLQRKDLEESTIPQPQSHFDVQLSQAKFQTPQYSELPPILSSPTFQTSRNSKLPKIPGTKNPYRSHIKFARE